MAHIPVAKTIVALGQRRFGDPLELVRLALKWVAVVLLAGVAAFFVAHRLEHRAAPRTPQRAGPLALPVVNLAMRGASLRLAVIGDVHGDARSVAAAIQLAHHSNAFDGILMLGDNFGNCGVASLADPQWQAMNPLLNIGIPVFPLLGNHDYGNPKPRPFGIIDICGEPDPDAQTRVSKHSSWNFPSRNYLLSTPVADIVMMDSTPVYMDLREGVLGSDSAAAVSNAVTTQLRKPGRRWRIVAGHHNAAHSGRLKARNEQPRRVMGDFVSLLREAGADAYFSAHQHQVELLRETAESPLLLISGASSRPTAPALLQQRREEHSIFLGLIPAHSIAFAVVEIDSEVMRIVFLGADARPLSAVFETRGLLRAFSTPQRGRSR